MTPNEMVTQFPLRSRTDEGVQMARVMELIRAVNAHLKSKDMAPEEYGFDLGCELAYDGHGRRSPAERDGARVPEKYWRLIAFAVEGGSEGYYIHFGALIAAEQAREGDYQDRVNRLVIASKRAADASTAPHTDPDLRELRRACDAVRYHEHAPSRYLEFGLAKTWSAERAYDIAREVQRFLIAAEWNECDARTETLKEMYAEET